MDNVLRASHRFDNSKRRRPEEHDRQAMLTPRYVLEPLRHLMGGIELDPCTEPDNPTKASRFYHLPSDGVMLPWDACSIFCNPPYGEVRGRWVERCILAGKEGRKVALLMPASTETQQFQRAAFHADTLLLFRGRLKFGVLRENGRQEAASHGSALFGFNLDLFSMPQKLGIVVRL